MAAYQLIMIRNYAEIIKVFFVSYSISISTSF